jgi:hypothetical protein
MATGQNIRASDYNAIRTKVEQVLDTGGTVGGTKGYGQPLISKPAEPINDIITRDQWEALRRDILNIKIHQENPKNSSNQVIFPVVIPIPTDDPIRFGSSHPNTNFNNLIDQLGITSLQIAEGRSTLTSVITPPRERITSWSTKVSCDINVVFEGYIRSDGYVVTPLNHARFFFNSGGKIRISSSRRDGSPTGQNNAWTSLLVQAAIRELSATSNNVNFYTLTPAFQTLYQLSSSTPYTANKYIIDVRGEDFDPSVGIATKVGFRITWEDGYTDPFPDRPPPDLVDGTLKLFVEELKAAGKIFNSTSTVESSSATLNGLWNVPSPLYSISDIYDS